LRHRWKRLVRTSTPGARWISVLAILFLGGYVAVAAIALGALFPVMAAELAPQADPVALLNAHLLTGLLGLVVTRFFFQPSPRTDLRPYLPRPLPRHRLAHLVQGLSAVGLFNGLALCFLVPAWLSTVRPAASAGGFAWLGGALLLVLATHYLVLPLRIGAGWYGRRFWIGAGAAGALLALDQAAGPHVVQGLSERLFGTLLSGRMAGLLVPAALAAGAYAASVRLLLRALRTDPGGASRGGRLRLLQRPLAWLVRRGAVEALVAVELRLILRNNRPRTHIAFSVLIGLGWPFFLRGDMADSAFIAALAGLVSTGAFAMSYGQHLFSWNSAHLAGTLARTRSPRTLIASKLWLMQGFCLVLWLLGLPLVLMTLPGFAPVHAAFLLFNAGITCPLHVATGALATKPLNLSKGMFFNYEGLSWLTFANIAVLFGLAFVLTLPPAPWGLVLTGGAGLVSFAATPLWTRALARLFAKRRHRMLAGFRAS
jgi:hypothetical protein